MQIAKITRGQCNTINYRNRLFANAIYAVVRVERKEERGPHRNISPFNGPTERMKNLYIKWEMINKIRITLRSKAVALGLLLSMRINASASTTMRRHEPGILSRALSAFSFASVKSKHSLFLAPSSLSLHSR